MNILLTGGTGYIGSHTAVVLLKAGQQVVLYDNLSNSNPDVVNRIEQITRLRPHFVEGDVRDTAFLTRTLQTRQIDAVIHFAGLKAVGESGEKPIDYHDNNVGGTISLLRAMQVNSINTMVFSSSATVYGNPQYLPIDEVHPTSATNPYGRSKLHIEEMLGDVAKAYSNWRIACLRYFNPVGAHDSGLIGEDPNGTPNNLMPYIASVAAGKLSHVNIFGNDYATLDGTGVRDYIHVMDLAEGHLAALNFLGHHASSAMTPSENFHIFNLGTGKGYSVLDMIKTFEAVSGRPVPYQVASRRTGDTAACYAQVDKSARELGWKANRTVTDMCTSAWHFEAHRGRICTTPLISS